MRLLQRLFGLAMSFVLVACGNADGDESTSGTSALTPSVSVKDIMVGSIEPASNGLWAAAMDENAPQTDEDWRTLEQHAIQLITAASAITLGGTGAKDIAYSQDPRWLQHSKEMAKFANESLVAIRARDLDATLEAGNFLIEPCSNCHSDFPPSGQ